MDHNINDGEESLVRDLGFLERLRIITTFVFDIDGVLTDGTVLAAESGELLRSFNTKDGYALQLAAKKGYNICIISGGKGAAINKRFESLGVADVFLGVDEKIIVFNNYIHQKGIDPQQILYMGDDIPDAEVMKLVGIATCPADAVEEIKAISHYISPKFGGKAAARDVIEKVLKVQHNWYGNIPSAAEASK
ncbi:MAG: HAD hydrolase family protein [Pedobacter sp.]|uniref:KdsC family phosphatase n=1 Tax=Pedobacter sp. TaxID=1411316 RepID=UPI0028093C14|nr:HAD hydrolase family protein [Pedobacter sp.]MDQ8003263.1 HAD hydrolase family protein [Pedobacter sp.]